jgi:hypothetical protein
MTVRQNVAFGLALRHVEEAAIATRVRDMLRAASRRLRGPAAAPCFPAGNSSASRSRGASSSSVGAAAGLDRSPRSTASCAEMRREIRALQRQLGITRSSSRTIRRRR